MRYWPQKTNLRFCNHQMHCGRSICFRGQEFHGPTKQGFFQVIQGQMRRFLHSQKISPPLDALLLTMFNIVTENVDHVALVGQVSGVFLVVWSTLYLFFFPLSRYLWPSHFNKLTSHQKYEWSARYAPLYAMFAAHQRHSSE